MSAGLAIGLLFFVLLALMASGMRIAYVMIGVGLMGLFFLVSPAQPQIAGGQMFNTAFSYTLSTVPLFILMSEFLTRSGTMSNAYDAIRVWFSPVRGCEAHSTVVACGIFAALSGSSVANAAAIGTAAIPDMVRRGYGRKLAFGVVAAGGTLGILIPPSIPIIIYGAFTGESVGHLFMAGVVPGVLLLLMYMGVVALWGWRRPADYPSVGTEKITWQQRFRSLGTVLPAIILIVIVLGGIYGGVFTPTEAAAIGASASLVIALIERKMSWAVLGDSLSSTLRVTSTTMFIVLGASLITYVMGYMGLAASLAKAVVTSGLPLWVIQVLIALVYIVLGCFVESVSLIVLTVPVVYPVIKALGLDPVWFGIVLVIYVEMSLITPPVGMNLFVIQAIAGEDTFGDASAGAMPFFVAQVILVVLLSAIPAMALWLPSMMVRLR